MNRHCLAALVKTDWRRDSESFHLLPLQFCKKAFPPCQTLIIYALLGSTKASRAISNNPSCVCSLIKLAAMESSPRKGFITFRLWSECEDVYVGVNKGTDGRLHAAEGRTHGRSHRVPAAHPRTAATWGLGGADFGRKTPKIPCPGGLGCARCGGAHLLQAQPGCRARRRARVCTHVPGAAGEGVGAHGPACACPATRVLASPHARHDSRRPQLGMSG